LRVPVDTHSTFVRGLVFGIGGAIVGLVIYSAFGIITGLVIGYVSLAVGYIVGKAMMKGSNGIGGRRYQVAAVLLTYSAVSMSAVPIGISQFMKQKKAQQQNLVRHDPAAGPQSDSAASSEPAADVDAPSQPTPGKPKPSLGAALGMLAIAGLTSPFLELQDPLHGVIGLIILFVGMRIAWSLTAGAKLDILGPFRTSPQPANAPAGS
jgi:hypothetical protein